ncbi:helix-turn-helix domain-containing protein [Streptomyces scabichelini]
MGNLGESSPYEARDAAGFVESMRRLKERSGLTYRELEERAARSGDVLARSTLADILRRTSLPRPEVLAAFVRACGDGQRVGAWLDARDRIAAGISAAPVLAPGSGPDADAPAGVPGPRPDADAPAGVPGPGPDADAPAGVPGPGPDADAPAAVPDHGTDADADADADAGATARPPTEQSVASRPRRAKRRAVAFALSLMVPMLALGAWGLLPDRSDSSDSSDSSADPGASAGPATASRTPADGWVTIRPARTPDLCLTDGRDRDGAYANAIAVQLPCAQVTVPRTYLEPAGEGLYRIQWHHPTEGKGCLTVMSTGPVKGMLEPRNDCAQATLFRLEPTAADSTGGFRLRPVGTSRCIGIVGNDTTEGAEAAEEGCTGAADQRFLIRAG